MKVNKEDGYLSVINCLKLDGEKYEGRKILVNLPDTDNYHPEENDDQIVDENEKVDEDIEVRYFDG